MYLVARGLAGIAALPWTKNAPRPLGAQGRCPGRSGMTGMSGSGMADGPASEFMVGGERRHPLFQKPELL